MGCRPSCHRSRSETGLKYGVTDDNGDDVIDESLDWTHSNGEGRPLLPSIFFDKKQEDIKDTPLQNRFNTLKLGPMCLSMPKIKVLLVFGKSEAQCDALCRACEKLHYNVDIAHNSDDALSNYRHNHHHLIFIDARQPHLFDPSSTCRSIRSIKGSQYACIVAVMRRNWTEKEESSIIPYLRAGFNRWLVENCSTSYCVNELIQLECNDVASQMKLKATAALLTAFNHTKDGIIVSSKNHEIQFVNPGMERLLGYKYDDLVGRHADELHKNEMFKNDVSESINTSVRKGKEWEGTLYHRRKSGELISLWSKIFPVQTCEGMIDHYVYLKEFPFYPIERILSPEGAGLNRRHSYAKFHPLTLEAPITKTLEKVVEILRNADTYSPNLTGIPPLKVDDQLTNDLLTGLIHSNKSTGVRRMSHEQVVQKSSSGLPQSPITAQTPLNLATMSPEIRKQLEQQWDWEFSIIEFERVTNKKPLFWLGFSILQSFNVCSNLNCDENTLQNWLMTVESRYRDNPYHNSTHATDVMQATAYFLRKSRLKAVFDPLDETICLLSAIVHDIDHPGKSSAFLCNSNNELAILYNDISVLESHHAAQAFKLTLADDKINIFKNMDRDTYREVRQSIIDMVLATEMTKHFEHLTKFISVFISPLKLDESDSSMMEISLDPIRDPGAATPENIVIIKRMLIKCADVSNPVRPLPLCKAWAGRIAEEYCNQTDEEKANGLPVVMPAFDRSTCSIPKSQIGFIDYFANDMFEAWDEFGGFPELIDNLKSNYAYYKEEEKKESENKVRGSLNEGANQSTSS
ncbi:phosphodiesterase 8 isoform X2 [Brevipalpus obovatus]|uniref:phosphodiesterase 8 isoform X2 n=1 Tax=Brevipalpus obovatus TaxID=246614 RepID=UPI003D9EED0D